MTASTASRMTSNTRNPMICPVVMVRIEPNRIDCICWEAELDNLAKNRPRTGGEGQHGAGGDLSLRGAFAERADDQRAAQRENAQPQRDRQAEQHRAGGPGQPDMGQGMRGRRWSVVRW